MVPRDARLAPLSLRAALLLLVPLALLGTLLLGLLAQSATAGDPVPPPSITGGPADGDDATPTWTYTLPPASTVGPTPTTEPATGTVTIARSYTGECAVTRVAPAPDTAYSSGAPCNVVFDVDESSYTGAVDTDGSYVFSVRTVEVEETTFTPEVGSPTTTTATYRSAPSTSTFVYDGNAPVVTVTGPASGSGRSPAFSVGIQDATGTAPTCSVDGGAAVSACAVGVDGLVLDLTGRPDGTFTVSVSATDAGGRTTTDTASYVLDAFSVGLSGPTTGSSLTPTWTASGGPFTSFTCNIVGDGNPTVTACDPSGITVSLPSTGTTGTLFTLSVTASDGINEPQTASAGYLLDTRVDAVVVGPPSPGRSTTPSWSLLADEPVDVLGCVLEADGVEVANAGTCSAAGFTAAPLPDADGTSYVLVMTVQDDQANVQDLTSAPYVLDNTPATLTLVAGQDPVDNETSPSWSFTGDTWTGVGCTLTTGGTEVPGGSCGPTGYTAPALPPTTDAEYVLSVTATDSVGNPVSATATYTLDTIAELVITEPSSPGNDTTPSWTFSTEAGASVTCSLAGAGANGGSCSTAGFEAAALPTTSGASYVLTVTVTDGRGNVTTYETSAYVLDTDAVAGFTGQPPAVGSSPTPSWSYTVESGSTVTCSFSGPDATGGSCTATGFTANALPASPGADYVLAVTVVDARGNTTTLTGTYRLDSVAVLTPASSPSSPGADASPTWTWTSEPDVTATCRLVDQDGTVIDDAACTTATSFTPGTDLPGTSGTTYTLTVTVIDPLGNSATTTLPTYRLDTVSDTALVSAPTTPGQDRSPTWAWTAETGASATCVLRTGAGAVVYSGACSSPTGFTSADLPPTTGTTYTLTVTVVDGLGNSTTFLAPGYRLDTIAELTAGDAPASPDNDTSPTWTWAAESGATVTCELRDDTGAVVFDDACSTASSFTSAALPGTSGTTYTLRVTVVDGVGNTSTTTLPTYLLDTTVDVTVTAPASPSRDTTPGWTWSVESGTTVQCSLSGPDAAGGICDASGFTASTLPPTAGADYVLTVTFTDGVGNETVHVSGVFHLDTVAELSPGTAPTSPGNDTSPTWTWTAEASSTVTCVLRDDSSAVVYDGACSTASSFTAATLPTTSGTTYTLTVTVVDALSNITSLALAPYLLDTIADVAAADSPTSPNNDTTPTWTWTIEDGATVSCRLVADTGSVVVDGACSSPISFTPATALQDSSGTTYTLTVTVVDELGNTRTLGLPTYRLDTVADVVIGAGPPSPGNDTSPTWSFTAETGATVVCTLTGPDANGGTCEGTGFTAALLPGTTGATYGVTITVTDALGNVTTRVLSTYLLDTIAEFAAGDAPPSPGNDTSPTWTWTAEAGSTVTCVLRTAPTGAPVYSGACTTAGSFTPPTDLPPTSGTTYTLRVTVVDALGNSTTTTLPTYLLDTSSDVTVVSSPASPGNDTSPTWTWTVESGSSSSCLLVDDTGTVMFDGACTTATSFEAADLPDTSGTTYTLTITVVDALGNSTTTALPTYLLDTVADFAPGAAPPSPGSDTSPSWTWTAEADATVTCVLRDDTGAVVFDGACSTASSFTAATLPATSGTTYTLTVTVVDALGNSTTTALPTYLLDTVADFAAGAAPPSPGSDTSPSWTWTAEADATVTCVLRDDTGAVVFDGACSTASSFTAATLPATSGTTYTLTVTVVDTLGNSTTTTLPTYLLDTVSDVTPGTAPPSPGNDTTPTWTWTAEVDATATCELVDDTGAVVFDGACSTATSFTADVLPGTIGTTYTLTITVVDALGNSTTTTLATLLLDTVLELDVTGPTGPSPVRTPAWSFTAEPLTTLVCTLTGPDGVVIDGGVCDQNGYRAPPLVEDGDHVLTVRGVDAAGNDVTQTFGYDLDTLHFSIDGPTGPSPDRTPAWTFTDEPYVSADCVLTGPDGVVFDGPCTTTSSFTADALPLTAGADYVLTVTVVDSIGNEGTVVTPPYRLDTQLPVAVITVPSSPSRAATVTWTVAVDEPLLSATCELRRDGVVVLSLANCPGSTSVTLPGDGRYDLVVTLVDLAGNSSTTTSTVLVHDATVPVAPQVSPSSVTSNRTTATWTISAEGGTALTTCRVLLGGAVFVDWATCGATFTLPLGVDGSYVLEVVSTDPVGPGPTTRVSYLLDTMAPVAPQLTGPTGPSPSRAPSWSIGTESGTSVECRLVRSGTVVLDWTACAGSITADVTGLPDGGYVLEARATDVAGNVSPVGTSAVYVLDTTAPVAAVVSGPSGPAQLRTPAFTWTGEAGARAECQLSRDGAAVGGWVTCSSGYAPVLDRDGTWTLAVRLTDAAGNVGDPASSSGYVLDTTAPPAPVVTPPQTPGRDLAPSWGVIVESGASLECRLTGPDGVTGAWAPCALPHVTSLTGRPDGAYVLEVRATDVAGNVSPVGSGTYVLDTVAPEAAVVTAPASPSRTRTPSFTFTVEPGSSSRCRVTSGSTVVSDFVACTGSFTVDLTGLPDGAYTVTVRVSDAAGNPGPAASGTYVLDTTGPAAAVLGTSPASPSPSRSATWTFSYEPGATLICRLTFPTGAVREIASCTSPLTIDLSGLPDGSYTLTVRAVDAAGNVGGVLTDTHVIDSTALAPPTVSGPVTPGSTRTPRWTFSSATATECRLSRGTTVLVDWTACATQYVAALFNQPDGTYTLSVRSTANGQVSAAAASRYVLDTTGPGAATITAPPTPSTNLQPVWTIASAELGATAECRLLYFGSVLRDWAPCGVTPEGALFDEADLTDRSDGTYTLVVRLTDAAGNRGVEASSAYVLDTSAPVGVGVTGPPSPGNDTSPTWTFTTAGALVLECRLTSEAGTISDWDTCVDSFTADLSEQPDGVYFLSVRAVSEAGTPGPETTVPYILSTLAPDGPSLLVLSGTKPVDNDRSPTWTFTLPTGTTGRCVLMSGTRTIADQTCTDTFTADLSRAADGSYTLHVYAVGEAGTESEPATSTYRLDVSAPSSPTFTVVPGTPGSTLTPQWRFTTVYGSTAECRVRFGSTALGDWAPCTSPYDLDLTLRPDGEYVLEVRAVDDAGNSSAPRSSTYVLDRTAAPVVTFTATPETPGSDRTVSWTFTAPEGYALECRLISPDGATGWAPCGTTTAALRTTGSLVVGSTGNYALNLNGRPDGEYVLEVRVVDATGVGGSASRATYWLDTRAPDAPAFSDPAPAAGNDPRPVWSWETTGDDWVECRLLRNGVEVQGWAECSSPHEARLGSQGTYRLEIRLVDAAGNRSAATGSSYVYDTTPPERPVLVGPPSSGSDRTVSWTFAMPAGATATCTVTRGLNRVDERSCNGRYDLDLTGRPDGTYTLTVRFTDAAGNVGAPASGQYALRTVGLPGRVVAPPSSGGAGPSAPSGAGRGGTGAVVDRPQGSTSRPGVPTIIPGDDDVVPRDRADRPSTFTPSAPGEEAAAADEPGESDDAGGGTALADPFPFQKVPDVLREAVTGTITRPTLPLALLAIVVLFLLAQNRIDRRDPKLASAPVEAEPELDFTLIVRRPGGALS